MPIKRWYQLCFAPTSDSSDDSDTESVDVRLLFSPGLPPRPPSQGVRGATAFDIESRHVSFSVVEQGWSEDDESEHCLQAPHGVINDIHKVTISELNERDEMSHCPICMEEFKVGNQACVLPCNHTYCCECILRWLNKSKTCPVCRIQLDDWEGYVDSESMDDNSLDLGPEIPPPPPPPPPPVIRADSVWDFLFLSSPDSQVGENSSTDENSDEAGHSYCIL